jgi:hypothetical protein
MLSGRCLCGTVRYELHGRLGPLAYCHCKMCQRASGSAFAANASVRTQYLTWLGGRDTITEYESSPGKLRAFCSRCGSPIYSRRTAAPNEVRIRLGTMDGDPERRSLAHFWVSSKAPWFEITDELPRYPGETPEGDDSPPVAPPGAQVIQLLWGFMVSQAVHVAAKLAVFDVLRDGPKTAGEVAAACRAQAPAVHRVLRFLTTVDVLREDDDGRFSATALGDTLRSDHPQSMRPLALMYAELFWDAWGKLYETVKTGRPGFQCAHGEAMFDYLQQRPAAAAIFNAGMTSASGLDVPLLLAAYDFSAFRTIVDVGGGHGALLRAILERAPNSVGVLCDRPEVLAGATELTKSAVAQRCTLVGIDMFESVPAGGDAYVLKRILHDWSDDESVVILRNCRRAIAADGKVLVMDAVVKPPNQPDPAKWMDLNMLALLTGRERTETEFGELFAKAGFRLTRIVPTTRVSIVEGVPV